MHSYSILILGCLVPMLAVAACDDPFYGRPDPRIATDTLDVAAPSAAPQPLPTALDVTASNGAVRGGRFPERVPDANVGWDLAVRVREGQLVLVPSGAFAGFGGRAGVSGPVSGTTFEALEEVPSGVRFETEVPVAAQAGAVYLIRSREFATGFGACLQYAKLQVLKVDEEPAAARVRIATNEQCYDTRLVPVDG